MVPENAILAFPVVALFLGDVLKRFGLNDWLIAVNMAVGGVLAVTLAGYWDMMTFIMGMELGLGGTGIHKLRKKVSNKVLTKGGSE